MFENKTFESIRYEMLNEVTNGVDKRDNSVIWDAISPAALKIAEFYTYLDVYLNLTFADTTSGDYLTRKASELGVIRKLATKAVRKATFKDGQGTLIDVPIGSRFSLNEFSFVVTERVTLGEFKLTAEVAGVLGNLGTGDLIPVEPVNGLGVATMTDVLVAGTDEESDADLYARYLIRTRKQPTSGNAYHYEQWALEVPGVGGAKVIPVWAGPNTVKVVLVGLDKKPVLPLIVTNTAAYIESVRPIGATVTVVSSVELPITVTATLTLAPGAELLNVQAQFKAALEDYLKSVAFVTNQLTNEPELIRYTRIANLLLDIPPIIDFTNLLVNGGTANIQPTLEQVGVVNSVVFT